MKSNILATAGLMAATLAAQATLYSSGTLSSGTAIPDGSTVGITESFTESGIPDVDLNNNSTINNVSVQLNISGGYNGDLYGYLVLQSTDGTTATAILLNRIGTTSSNPIGSAGAGMNVTLSEGTANDIHAAGSGLLSGTYSADGRAADPSVVVDTSPRTAGLDVLNGLSANGTWTLYLADLSAGGGTAQLNSWGLEINVVPEPVTWALAGFGLALGLARLATWRIQHARQV